MAIQFIMGNSGSGKTHYLYEKIIKESMENPNRNYLVIVPEQFTMQTQKELVQRHPNGGILNIDVLSFGRLAHRIFEEVGRNYGVILDDEGKNLVLRRIAHTYDDELRVVGKNLKKFGYISEVKSVISEFTQYDVNLERIQELKQRVPENTVLAYKLADMEVLYRGFYEYLEGKVITDGQAITDEQLLDYLSKVVPESKILEDCVLTFDGFTGFTPVQNRLITELIKVSYEVYFTATMDEKSAKQILAKPDQVEQKNLFAMTQEMLADVIWIAEQNKIPVKQSVLLFENQNYRFQNNPPMEFLETHLFRYGNQKYEEEQKMISAHVHRNPVAESNWIVGEIRRLVRTEGYKYKDFAIITTAMDAYGTHLNRAGERYDVPVFVDQPRSILLNAFVEYLRSLLAMIYTNYTYDTTFRFLKAGFSKGSSGTLSKVENYVLSRGIRGYTKWNKEWIEESENAQFMEGLNGYRVDFMNIIRPLHKVLSKKRNSVEDICTALYEFIVANKLQYKLACLEYDLQTEGRISLAKEYNQIYGIVMGLLDKFVALLGEEEVSLKEFQELFDAGIQEARVGIIPPSIDTVTVGDLTRTRVDHVKVLFFAGINDTYLPGKMNGGGLLSDQDRTKLKEIVRLKPNAREQMYRQKFYLYLSLLKPSDHLYLSLSKTSMEGKSIRPAYIMNEFRKLFPKMHLQEEQSELNQVEMTAVVGLPYIIEGFKQKESERSSTWKALYAWYQEQPEWKELIAFVEYARGTKNPKDTLTKSVAKDLYGEVLKNSVTRLEKFASCPYAHFLLYGLGLKERDLHEFEPVDLGNVFHKAIELYSLNLQNEKKEWTDITAEEQKQWAEDAVEKSIEAYQHEVLHKSERDEYHIQRMKRLMCRSVWAVTKQLEKGVFHPESYELEYGENQELECTRYTLSEGQEMILRGKIDRVDVYEDDKEKGNSDVYVKIVDYKTGNKEISLSELYYGLQLQLFVYLQAAMESKQKKVLDNQRVVPAGVMYYRVDDPLVELSDKERSGIQDTAKRELIEKGILENLVPDGILNDAAAIVRMFDAEFTSKSEVIPVRWDEKAGGIKASKNAMSTSDFEQVLQFTRGKIEEIGNEIVQGNIEVLPYQEDKKTGCEYCKFGEICGFDSKIPGYSYQKLSKCDNKAALQLIEEANSEKQKSQEKQQEQSQEQEGGQ